MKKVRKTFTTGFVDTIFIIRGGVKVIKNNKSILYPYPQSWAQPLLFVQACQEQIKTAWKSRQHEDGFMYAGMFAAGFEAPGGPVVLHMNLVYWYLYSRIPEVEKAPPFIMQPPAVVMERIKPFLPRIIIVE